MLDITIGYPDSPADARPIAEWLEQLPKGAVAKIVVLGKTEGPATLNDFSRDLAQAATDRALSEAGGHLAARAVRLFSTGCEGIATPLTIMMAEIAAPNARPAMSQGLVVGVACSESLPPFPRCGIAHIDAAAQAVESAMTDADLRPEQVALVLIKSPILAPEATPAGAGSFRRHAGSTGSSRGAAAIGAGIALGEIARTDLSPDPVGRDGVFASRVMSFSGIETDRIEAVVLGERPGGDPRWSISVAMIADFLDRDGIARLQSRSAQQPQLVFFKAGIRPDGRMRGRRTTVLSSDLSADKQLRAAASGFIAAHFGTTAAFISGGAEHQAPAGACLCATLHRLE
jgi:cyanuric acid amidohydrolase